MRFLSLRKVPAAAAIVLFGAASIVSQCYAQVSSTGTSTNQVVRETNNYLGLNAGAGFLAKQGGSHVGFGGTLGHHLNPDWALGVFYSRVNRGTFTSDETGGVSADGSLSFYGAELAYFPEAFPGVQIGAKSALGVNSITVNGATNSNSDFYIGPKLGYDVSVGSGFSLGGEANILATPATGGKTTTNLLVALKYWLS